MQKSIFKNNLHNCMRVGVLLGFAASFLDGLAPCRAFFGLSCNLYRGFSNISGILEFFLSNIPGILLNHRTRNLQDFFLESPGQSPRQSNMPWLIAFSCRSLGLTRHRTYKRKRVNTSSGRRHVCGGQCRGVAGEGVSRCVMGVWARAEWRVACRGVAGGVVDTEW